MTLSVILPRRGWTLVKKTKSYVYVIPPLDQTSPPFHIPIAVPTPQECLEIARRSYAKGQSWMGQLTGPPRVVSPRKDHPDRGDAGRPRDWRVADDWPPSVIAGVEFLDRPRGRLELCCYRRRRRVCDRRTAASPTSHAPGERWRRPPQQI